MKAISVLAFVIGLLAAINCQRRAPEVAREVPPTAPLIEMRPAADAGHKVDGGALSKSTEVVPIPAEPPMSPTCEDRCAHEGLCVADAEGRCVASTVGCEQSEVCQIYGWCAPTDRRSCRAASDEHCQASERCKAYGECVLAGASCVAPCDVELLRGLQLPLQKYPRSCLRGDDRRPCPQTEVCEEFGICESQGRFCQGVDLECRRAEACSKRGKCYRGWYEDDPCIARTSEDCRASIGCVEDGRCHALDGECVTDSEAEHHCGKDRVLENGVCYRPIGYDCKEECAAMNRCRPKVFDERYVVCIETEEYCGNHPDCRAKGICTVNTRSVHYYNKCGESSGSMHACGGWAHGGCVKAEEDCQKSVDCKRRGNCSAATPSRYCRPTRKEHCQQSEICKNEGQCKLLDESSYFICGD